jgi:hypothetical protein
VMPKLSLAFATAGFLGVVSGATRKTALPHLLDAPPSIESAVFPAPVPPPTLTRGASQEQP